MTYRDTPDILHDALRQYVALDRSGLAIGFDHDDTARIVEEMVAWQKVCNANFIELVCAVKAGESGISVNDVDGKDWFAFRREMLGEALSYGTEGGDKLWRKNE